MSRFDSQNIWPACHGLATIQSAWRRGFPKLQNSNNKQKIQIELRLGSNMSPIISRAIFPVLVLVLVAFAIPLANLRQ
jgi:hypothetical protein